MTQIRLCINIITFKHFLLAYDVSLYVENHILISTQVTKLNIKNAARGSLSLLKKKDVVKKQRML